MAAQAEAAKDKIARTPYSVPTVPKDLAGDMAHAREDATRQSHGAIGTFSGFTADRIGASVHPVFEKIANAVVGTEKNTRGLQPAGPNPVYQ